MITLYMLRSRLIGWSLYLPYPYHACHGFIVLVVIINYHQLSSIIINYHQLSSIINNYHQLSSIIINCHQLSSSIIKYHQLSSSIIKYHQLSSISLSCSLYYPCTSLLGLYQYHYTILLGDYIINIPVVLPQGTGICPKASNHSTRLRGPKARPVGCPATWGSPPNCREVGIHYGLLIIVLIVL
jgi:hypothetical protein